MPIENVNKEGVNHLYLMLEMEDAADRGQGNAVATRILNKKGDDENRNGRECRQLSEKLYC